MLMAIAVVVVDKVWLKYCISTQVTDGIPKVKVKFIYISLSHTGSQRALQTRSRNTSTPVTVAILAGMKTSNYREPESNYLCKDIS